MFDQSLGVTKVADGKLYRTIIKPGEEFTFVAVFGALRCIPILDCASSAVYLRE